MSKGKKMPTNEKVAEAITYLEPRVIHADANPIVPFAKSGDQNPITVEHSVMMSVLRMPEFQTDEWEPLYGMIRQCSSNTISREYPCLWIRAVVNRLKEI